MNETINIYGNITTSKRELRDLFKAWLVIALVFTIGTRGFSLGFLFGFIVSLLTVGIAFLLHEASHKIAAQKYGFEAEFRKFTPMLILSVILSFLGIIFIAPGAVMIKALGISPSENGKISLAGPVSNLVLGYILIISSFIVSIPVLKDVLLFGALVNCLIGLFNMIPFWLLDGKKIFSWDKKVYTVTIILFLVLYVMIKIPLMI